MFQTDRLLALNNSIGPSGILEVSDCYRGQRYRITFFPDVSTAQVKPLYASYEGILGGLEGWLRDEWAGFQPLWTEFSGAGFGDRYRQLQQADWRGLEKALHDIWDDIKQLFALLADLQANSEKLLQHASALKPLLVNARDVPLKPTPAIPLNIRQADSQVLTVPNPAPMARDKSRITTRMEHHEPRDDASNQAKNPNGDSADCALLTCTNGCPVSMVTGEELLTLTDGTLDGRLSFEFTRLYRTSAVEIDVGLGFGWSHSLAHRLAFDGDFVVWVDHENRRTRFPLPSVERPAIHNSLSRAAIFLGDEPEELIVALAGDAARFYHFRAGRLGAISDAYGNRLTVSRDHQERIVRLDNGAGRSLLLRYDRAQLVAVDYQSFGSDGTGWHTEQTLISYRYDARQRLLEATHSVGDSERYDYDDAHVILQRQLTGGASFFWEWERSSTA